DFPCVVCGALYARAVSDATGAGAGTADRDEPVLLVDARNVIRSRWPNIPDDRLVELARLWAVRERVRLLLVFDGPAPGGVLGTADVDERATVVGTGRESADDWIVREAERLASELHRAWLVTSDRALRVRAAPYVEQTTGGGAFARELEAFERPRE
ncbi:MAG: NYN domain-containing protein, partial [Gemmatimonadota bacterium]